MKKILTIVLTMLFIVSLLIIQQLQAQAPSKMSYQAVVRDASGTLVIDQEIGMRISILEGSSSGTAVYVETHNPTSNSNGLISIEIGDGSVVSGTFSDIDWSTEAFFIQTEIDPLGGSSYTITGTSQLMSVPYALYAEKAGNTFSGDYNDLSNIPTGSDFDGDFANLTNIPTGISDGDDDTQLTEAEVDDYVANNGYLTAEVDGSITNEIELPEQSGNAGLVLTTDGTNPAWSAVSYNDLTDVPSSSFDGEFSSLANVPAGLDDGDDDTQLSEAEVDTYVANNGYLTAEVDGSITNEIQDLQLTGHDLSITNNGSATTIDLSGYLDNTDTQLNESQVDTYVANNGYLTAEVDGSITNEIELPAQAGQAGKVLSTNGSSPEWITTSAGFDGEFSNLSNIPTGLSDGDDNTQLNETQVDAFVANNGYLTAEVDGSITNEIQDLQLSGNNLSITNNGSATTIDLSGYLDNTDTQLNETQVDAYVANNGYLTAEVDGSITNEIELPAQSGHSGKYLTTNGSSVSWDTPSSSPSVRTMSANTTLTTSDEIVIINGAFIATLPASPTDGQKLTVVSNNENAGVNRNGKPLYIANGLFDSSTTLTFLDTNSNLYTFVYSSTIGAWLSTY
ncbi:hypothetical protein SAMN04488029_1530 [Reichenbachiella faecimaris]|uniref:Uncharacterized protein n=1 Tax=Reichenbachiella faecimaris TaxID=692418 RepID=A0A1W2G904_REIFA|nr:hypothetical protein [Reichenbachiella faecimaris]SMD33165.1 hypothetical protein SAMN04488029_1530 [Reichenbachiella faecimaris]